MKDSKTISFPGYLFINAELTTWCYAYFYSKAPIKRALLAPTNQMKWLKTNSVFFPYPF